jgi:hypothetical protein
MVIFQPQGAMRIFAISVALSTPIFLVEIFFVENPMSKIFFVENPMSKIFSSKIFLIENRFGRKLTFVEKFRRKKFSTKKIGVHYPLLMFLSNFNPLLSSHTVFDITHIFISVLHILYTFLHTCKL